MHLMIGLGPIGGNVGVRLVQFQEPVYGYDLNPQRVTEWSAETSSPGSSDLAAVDWPSVSSVHIAVRTADQVASVFDSLRQYTSQPLTVFVYTTLAPADAREILSSAPDTWRVFEAPVSGGPQGAHDGSLTVFLSGPATTDAEDKLLTEISGHVFRMGSYGHPALVKLLNNTLGTFNLAATARILNLAEELGVTAQKMSEVIAVSTRRSWMSDNLTTVQYNLLLKDVGLLRGEIGALPEGTLDDSVEEAIISACASLSSESSDK